MAEQVITWRTADGESGRATAEILRYGQGARQLRAAGFIAAGLLGAAACIIVPVLHLITTWALPALGIFLGIRALKTPLRIVEIQGPCPKCGERLELPGGQPEDARSCPHCNASIELVLDDDAPAQEAGPKHIELS